MIIKQWILEKISIGEYFLRFDEKAKWRIVIKTPHPGCLHICQDCEVKVVPITEAFAISIFNVYGKTELDPDSEIEY